MLVIRLTRVGKKNQPSFRVILTEKANPVRGKFNEILGSYNPRSKEKALKVERIKYWLSKGAQPSATVHNMLVSEKIIDAKKVKAWRPKKKEKTEAKTTGEQSVKAETPAESGEVKLVETVAETKTEAPVEEAPASAPAEETKTEEKQPK